MGCSRSDDSWRWNGTARRTTPNHRARGTPPAPRLGRRSRFQLAGIRAGTLACGPEAMVRCLLVDDSAPFLDAARGLLERQGIAVVGTASTGEDALQWAQELRPDVVLVDLDLGRESGLELARRLHGQAGLAPVILISTHAEQDYAELIAASPAVGFLPKTALSADAIRDLLTSRATAQPPGEMAVGGEDTGPSRHDP